MKRNPVEITEESAASIAKWRIKEMIDNGSMDFIKKMAMQSAIQKGGGVDEIARILYGMGLRLTVDKNNETHQKWIAARAVVEIA